MYYEGLLHVLRYISCKYKDDERINAIKLQHLCLRSVVGIITHTEVILQSIHASVTTKKSLMQPRIGEISLNTKWCSVYITRSAYVSAIDDMSLMTTDNGIWLWALHYDGLDGEFWNAKIKMKMTVINAAVRHSKQPATLLAATFREARCRSVTYLQVV